MKTSTKWILGVVLGLVVIATILMIGYFVFNRWGVFGWAMAPRGVRPWNGERLMPMQPHWGLPNQRFTGLFPLRFIGGGLFLAGFLILVIFGVIALIRTLQSPKNRRLSLVQLLLPQCRPQLP